MSKKEYIILRNGSNDAKGCLTQIGETVSACIFLVVVYFLVKAGCH